MPLLSSSIQRGIRVSHERLASGGWSHRFPPAVRVCLGKSNDDGHNYNTINTPRRNPGFPLERWCMSLWDTALLYCWGLVCLVRSNSSSSSLLVVLLNEWVVYRYPMGPNSVQGKWIRLFVDDAITFWRKLVLSNLVLRRHPVRVHLYGHTNVRYVCVLYIIHIVAAHMNISALAGILALRTYALYYQNRIFKRVLTLLYVVCILLST